MGGRKINCVSLRRRQRRGGENSRKSQRGTPTRQKHRKPWWRWLVARKISISNRNGETCMQQRFFFRKRGNGFFCPTSGSAILALFSELAPYAIKPLPRFFFAGSIKEILYAAGPFLSDRRYKQKKREGIEGEGGKGTFPGLGHRITLEEGGGRTFLAWAAKGKGGGRNDHLFLKGGKGKKRSGGGGRCGKEAASAGEEGGGGKGGGRCHVFLFLDAVYFRARRRKERKPSSLFPLFFFGVPFLPSCCFASSTHLSSPAISRRSVGGGGGLRVLFSVKI